MKLLHSYYTKILWLPFDSASQEEFNGGNFVTIWLLNGEKIKKISKNSTKKALVRSAKNVQYRIKVFIDTEGGYIKN